MRVFDLWVLCLVSMSVFVSASASASASAGNSVRKIRVVVCVLDKSCSYQ